MPNDACRPKAKRKQAVNAHDPFRFRKRPLASGEGMAFIAKALTLEVDECIIFPGGRNADGYGNVRVGRDRFEYAHVLVCERAHGPRPSPEHVAAHSCGGGHIGCINKLHLSWKMPVGNVSDAVAHGTMSRGKKLTPEAVRSIRALAPVMRYRDIAKMFGVHGSTVSAIVRRRAWADVSEPARPTGDEEAA